MEPIFSIIVIVCEDRDKPPQAVFISQLNLPV